MLLEEFSYTEVEYYLQHNDTLLIPVGSVEQHSEYGIIGTDFIAAEGVARAVAEKMKLLVAPTVNYGVSPHHMEFKGSATLSPTTFISVIVDITRSFLKHGFKRIFFINGHGGNVGPLTVAMQEIKMQGAAGQLAFFPWYEGLRDTGFIEELFQNQDGRHATPSEISLTMALRPEVFTGKKKEKGEVRPCAHPWPLTAEEMRLIFPDGRMDAASWLASTEKGLSLLKQAVEKLAVKIEEQRRIELPLVD